METNDEEKIKKLIKTAYPKMMASPKEKVCPTEDALASFAEGKLEGKKEEQIISHLAICNDCLNNVKFLRQAPSPEEVSVPLWLKKKACDLFPEKPKTWEIVVGQARAVLEVIKHTAEECWTLPHLEVIPAKVRLEPVYALRVSPPTSDEHLFRSLAPPRKGVEEIGTEYFLETKYFEPPEPVPVPKDKILKSLKERISDGFVFLEHMGTYDVYLTIARKEEKRPGAFDVEIEVHDRSGRIAEEIEVLFIQGRKTIAKSVTRKQTRISKSLFPNKYSIKFRHKGLYLGQALLDLRGEKPEQSGSWD